MASPYIWVKTTINQGESLLLLIIIDGMKHIWPKFNSTEKYPIEIAAALEIQYTRYRFMVPVFWFPIMAKFQPNSSSMVSNYVQLIINDTRVSATMPGGKGHKLCGRGYWLFLLVHSLFFEINKALQTSTNSTSGADLFPFQNISLTVRLQKFMLRDG